jgi:bifunctional UDP-N-acetylglucosamine pyrophosphorylase/glucosamine-1-phosphate N-acetyltransferase
LSQRWAFWELLLRGRAHRNIDFMADALIMAAGLGTRMKSERAKVLHELLGRPLISYTLRAVFELAPEAIFVVVGYQAREVERVVRDEVARLTERSHSSTPQLQFALQKQQRGTGHAVMAARDLLASRRGPLVVVAADGPMLTSTTLKRLLETHISERNDVTILTAQMDDPAGYGRLIRNQQGRFLRIVEQKDASPEELAIREVGVSIYCFEIPALLAALDHLTADNAQGEYYITDAPAIIAAQGRQVGILLHDDPEEVAGINTRVELAEIEQKLRQRKLRELMLSGVTIIDPTTTYIHQDVEIGQDSIIHPQVIIEGASRIGKGCIIQSWTRLKNVQIGQGVTIKNHCVIEDCEILDNASVGPFARLRMQTEVGEKAVIGNFVEVKKSKIGRGTKAQHLAYLGDAKLGDNVNIGAGTVTCNFDGVRKHETIIEDDAKIGSDTMLVAPVRIGRGSVTGAGAVVTKDVPPDSLAVGVPATVKKKLNRTDC